MLFQKCPVKTHCGKWAQGSMEKGNPEFTCYNRSSGARFRIDRDYNDIKIASITTINHIQKIPL